MGKHWRLPLVLLVALASAALLWLRPSERRADPLPASPAAPVAKARPQPPLPPGVREVRTAHYLIHTAASDEQTRQVGEAAEALYQAYAEFFPEWVPATRAHPPLQLVLYRDQAQFKAYNRSQRWAEAYYLPPRSHAYFGDGDNPVHWMVHETTHQLNHEVAGLKRRKWIDEGLANYFGSSFLRDGKLQVGSIDAATYPIWWLPKLGLTGDMQRDIDAGRFIPLRAIVSGAGGPDFDRNVNLYYMEYWGLTHFLFEYHDGQYAQAYRTLIRAGGSAQDFERLVGPFDRIEAEWYAYLRKAAEAVAAHSDDEAPTRARVMPAAGATR